MTYPHATVPGSTATVRIGDPRMGGLHTGGLHTGGLRTGGLRIGDRYRLEDRLGRGAMAEVFRAHDETLDRRVALKIFHRTDSAEERARQQAEVAILAGLTHRNIVTAFDAGTDLADGSSAPRAFLVLELVAGCTLRSALADGPLEPALVRRLARQLADAVAYVHGQGIVHRDLKPANLLLAPCPDDVGETVVKLTDFGVAQVVDSPVTSFGESGGSANYVSPEQARGQDATRASDVYSLGLVLLECLTGKQAFPGEGTAAAVARLHRNATVPAGLGGEWVDLLTRMTATDPAQRPTAREVVRTLHAIGLPVALPAAAVEDRDADDLRGPLDGIDWIAGVSTRGRRTRPAPRHRARSGRHARPRLALGVAVAIIALLGAVPLMVSIARAAAGSRPDAADRPVHAIGLVAADPAHPASRPVRTASVITLADPVQAPPVAGFDAAARPTSTASPVAVARSTGHGRPPAPTTHASGRTKPHKPRNAHPKPGAKAHLKRHPKTHSKATRSHAPQAATRHPHTG